MSPYCLPKYKAMDRQSFFLSLVSDLTQVTQKTVLMVEDYEACGSLKETLDKTEKVVEAAGKKNAEILVENTELRNQKIKPRPTSCAAELSSERLMLMLTSEKRYYRRSTQKSWSPAEEALG